MLAMTKAVQFGVADPTMRLFVRSTPLFLVEALTLAVVKGPMQFGSPNRGGK